MIKIHKAIVIFLLAFFCTLNLQLIKAHANELEKEKNLATDPLTEWNELRESRNFRPLFSLKECSLTIFSFIELRFNHSVEELVKTFGRYDRKVSLVNDIYVWDDYGMSVYSKKDKAIITSVEFHLNRPEQRFSDQEEMKFAFNSGDMNRVEITKNIILAKPRKLFAGDFSLGILFMDEYFEMHKANAALRESYKLSADPDIEAIYKKFFPNTSENYFVKSNGSHDYIYDQPCPKDNSVTRLRIQPLNKDSNKIQMISLSSFNDDSNTEESYKASTTKIFQEIFDNDLDRWNRSREDINKPLFSLQQCRLEYKGQPLPFNALVEQWVDILGPYDSKVKTRSHDVYLWDRFGIGAYAANWNEGTIDRAGFYFNRRKKDDYPKQLFKGPLLLDGLLLDENFELNKANKALDQYYRDIADEQKSVKDKSYFYPSTKKLGLHHYVDACIESEQKIALSLIMFKEKPNKIWQITMDVAGYDLKEDKKLKAEEVEKEKALKRKIDETNKLIQEYYEENGKHIWDE